MASLEQHSHMLTAAVKRLRHTKEGSNAEAAAKADVLEQIDGAAAAVQGPRTGW